MVPGQANLNFQDTDMLDTLLGRAILQMASHFGVEVQVSEKAKDFVSVLKGTLCENTKVPKLFFSEHSGLSKLQSEKKNAPQGAGSVTKLRLFGIWPLNVIEKLSKEYDYDLDTKEIICNLNTETSPVNNLYRLLTFHQSFWTHHGLVNTDVYYSGVMPRVMRIKYNDSPTSVKGIKCLQLK